ncbi:MAG TPA: NAD-dependent epimerase/dehydratase family protein [Bacteroidales bacterium]|nr:NAD-dependent epimerase/dehydratase family protein [Bacteroidales bacterium]
MSKILVTGGAGMIGSNLVKRLVKENHNVLIIDNLWRGKLDYLNDDNGKPCIDLNRNFFNIDLSQPIIDLKPFEGTDYIYHLADVVAGISYVFNNQGSIFRQNVMINSNTIEMARQLRVKGFIYAGTACSFPLELQNSFDYKLLKEDELFPANPESAYGWSKLMGLYEADFLEKESGIPVLTLIFHNVYGAPCDFGTARSQVIPSLIRKAINYPSEDFIVWGSGRQGRAFLHIDDIINGLILGLEKGLGKGYIQIGPDYSTTIAELASQIVEISGKDIRIVFDTTKPEGDKARAANYSKATEVLGWKPRVSLKEGLTATYKWIEQRIAEQKD